MVKRVVRIEDNNDETRKRDDEFVAADFLAKYAREGRDFYKNKTEPAVRGGPARMRKDIYRNITKITQLVIYVNLLNFNLFFADGLKVVL